MCADAIQRSARVNPQLTEQKADRSCGKLQSTRLLTMWDGEAQLDVCVVLNQSPLTDKHTHTHTQLVQTKMVLFLKQLIQVLI